MLRRKTKLTDHKHHNILFHISHKSCKPERGKQLKLLFLLRFFSMNIKKKKNKSNVQDLIGPSFYRGELINFFWLLQRKNSVHISLKHVSKKGLVTTFVSIPASFIWIKHLMIKMVFNLFLTDLRWHPRKVYSVSKVTNWDKWHYELCMIILWLP